MQHKDDATLLHEFVSADYAARWPDHECPTLNDCAEFLSALTIDGAEDV
jgi:hypothetical protein